MERRQFLSGSAAVSGALVAGCLGGGGGGNQQQGGEVAITVTMKEGGTGFDPIRAKIDTGKAVKWKNTSESVHQVAAYTSSGSSEWEVDKKLEPEDTVTHTFDEKGVYLYRCTIHTRHLGCGVVLVGGVSFGETLPCE